MDHIEKPKGTDNSVGKAWEWGVGAGQMGDICYATNNKNIFQKKSILNWLNKNSKWLTLKEQLSKVKQ